MFVLENKTETLKKDTCLFFFCRMFNCPIHSSLLFL